MVKGSVIFGTYTVLVIHHATNYCSFFSIQDNVERVKEELYNFYCHGPGRNLNYSSLVFQLA